MRAIYDETEVRESNPTYTPFGVQTPNVAAASKTTETKGYIPFSGLDQPYHGDGRTL